MRRAVPRVASALLALQLAACTVGPAYRAPALGVPADFTIPQQAAAQRAAADQLRGWWRGFDDPALNALVDRLLAHNLDLQIAAQNLDVAEAARREAGAAALPQIDAGASATASNSSTTLQYPPGVGYYRTYALGFNASWELDIFGGVRRSEEAADGSYQAAFNQRRALLVALLGELARDYAALRATQLRHAIAARNVATAAESLRINQQGYARGLIGNLDVAQSAAELQTEQSALPALDDQAARLIDAIAVLAGAYPVQLRAALAQPAPVLPTPPLLPASLPSEVIANRPDIAAAERRLAADTARIGVAVSDLYPHFDIPMMLMPTTSYLRDLFTGASLAWSVGLSAAQGVYHGGARTARIDAARATAQADLLTYRKTVLTAFREVEDALVDVQTTTTRARLLHDAARHSSLAASRARRLFGAGLTDYLQVLITQRAATAADDAAAAADLDHVQAVITLYAALGGGWQGVFFAPAAR